MKFFEMPKSYCIAYVGLSIVVLVSLVADQTQSAPTVGDRDVLVKLLVVLGKLEKAYYHGSRVDNINLEDMNQLIDEINCWNERLFHEIHTDLPFLDTLVEAVKKVNGRCADQQCVEAIGETYVESRPHEVEDEFDVHDLSQTQAFKLSSSLKTGVPEMTDKLYQLGMEEYDLHKKELSRLGTQRSDLIIELTRIERLVDYMNQFAFLEAYRF